MSKWKMATSIDSLDAEVWDYIAKNVCYLQTIGHNGISVLVNYNIVTIREILMESLDE